MKINFFMNKEDKPYWYFIIILTIATFGLRLTNLGYLTLWVDEYVHANLAKYIDQGSLVGADNNGILFSISILPFFKLFGATEFWARFPSVIYGTLTIPLAFAFCKKYFNKRIGVIVAILLAVSLYVTFWSRIGRMYATVMFFYLLLVYVTAKLCNIDHSYQKRNQAFFDYVQFTPKTLISFVVCLVLAVLSQLSAVFIFFSISFFHLLLFIQSFFKKEKNSVSYTSIHAIFAYCFVVFFAIATIPSLQGIVKPILTLIFPANALGFLLPDWSHISTLPTFASFDLYCKVLSTDMPYFYILGWVGFILAVVKYKKVGLYLGSVFVLVFVLMSFLFRGVSLPRYLLFLYPYFLIAMAISIDEIIKLVSKMFNKKNQNTPSPKLFVGCLVILFLLLPFKAPYKLVTTRAHGQVVPKELSVWYFVNWQEPLKAINQAIQPGDAFLSTMSPYATFYLGKNPIMFRQMRYNSEKKQYETLPIDTTTDNAGSLEAVQRLFHNYKRGWLGADYYFDNVMTDPATRNFVIQNMQFMYAMSNSDVKVFHWDQSKPNVQKNVLLELLTQQSPISQSYTFGHISAPMGTVTLGIEAEGVTHDAELGVAINQNGYAVPISSGELVRKNRSSTERQWFFVKINVSSLRANKNDVQFYLPEVVQNQDKTNEEEKSLDNTSKIAVYNVQIF